MAWTNPTVRVADELIDQDDWNTDIEYNLFALDQHLHTGAGGDGATIAGITTPFVGTSYYFLPNPYNALVSALSGESVFANANQVRWIRFYMPFQLTLTFMSVDVTTAVAASTLGVGIYSNGGTSLLANGTSAATATGVKRMAVTSILLDIGFYLLAWTCTHATVQITGWSNFTDGHAVVNATNPHWGTAANVSIAGVLPATTGVLSANNQVMPCIKLEG